MKDELPSLFGGLTGEAPKGFHRGGLVGNLRPYQRAFIDRLPLMTFPTVNKRRISADTATMLDDLERNRPTMDPTTRVITIRFTVEDRATPGLNRLSESLDRLIKVARDDVERRWQRRFDAALLEAMRTQAVDTDPIIPDKDRK